MHGWKQPVYRLGAGVWLLLCCCILLSCNNHNNSLNRLSKASSPYLREHADNPVNWYEWGDEALAAAKAADKPLLISIGYAACHWCHEMEKESFMDTAVARLMNEHFICIKVDREERPDIDNLYMHACQLLNNGQAGWPLNAFALPDGRPFFAGTYFAKENWISLLKQVSTAYITKRNKVSLQAASLSFGMMDQDSLMLFHTASNAQDQSGYQKLYDNIISQVDTVNGGLKGQQKFPTPAVWELLLQYHYYNNDTQSLLAAETSLKKMALGGIYDQVGGGFARYATDSLWRIPHYEKMLYDNAQLVSLYAHAYQVTKDVFYKQVAEETLHFVETSLAAPSAGFYASLNADTKEGEGAYYSWSPQELQEIVANRKVEAYYRLENINQQKGILYALEEPGSYAKKENIPVTEFDQLLQSAKAKLLAERNKRIKPSVDEKILLSWNALMLKAYADACLAFGNTNYLDKALVNAAFIEKTMMQPNGKLWRNFAQGKASIDGFLEDYALLANAFLRLYEVSFDDHWLQLAHKITSYCLGHFYDAKTGLFFFTDKDATPLALRKIEILNSTMPSSNAVMAKVLYTLGLLLDRNDYIEQSEAMLSKINFQDVGAADWGLAMGEQWHPVKEVAIMGPEALSKNLSLQQQYLPGCFFMGGQQENIPLLKGKLPASGTLIYVCTNKTCQRPVAEVPLALQQIGGQ